MDNISQEGIAVEKEAQIRYFIIALAVSAIAVGISNSLVNLLLVDIASTFQVNEGVAVQLRTVNALAEVVFGVLMGFLAVRFRHKSLLLVGVLLVAFSAVGSFFAPTLSLMLFFSFVEGSGSIMVTIMAFTLIGDSISLNKKAKAVSWVLAAGYMFSLFGTPLINFFADVGGWRYVFSLLVLPFSIVGLVLSLFGIPSHKSETNQPTIEKGTNPRYFRQLFLNKSVVSCLIGGVFFAAAYVGIFAIAFYRQYYLVPRDYTVYIMLGVASICIVGSLIAGRLVDRFGSKSLAAASVLGSGIFSLLLFFAPYVWVALIFNFLDAWFIAVGISAYHCLVLEQVPMFRGTMVSFYRVFIGLGGIIAPAVGGSLLVLFSSSIEIGYQAVGIGFGAMTLASAGILHFFVKDTKLKAV